MPLLREMSVTCTSTQSKTGKTWTWNKQEMSLSEHACKRELFIAASMRSRDLIQQILNVSEKAAVLARTIRAEKSLFRLLVQEKTGDEKNKRFIQDFKTLADVLVQQTIQHDLGKQFPSLSDKIFGEESNKFTNVLGETVAVEIKSTVQETADLLGLVLDGNADAAKLLAEVVHQNITVETDVSDSQLDTEIVDGSIGIWIDPIDSTAQYINGEDSARHESGVYTRGLQSVLVLIGAYDLTSGASVVGVVNQPFSQRDSESERWQGRAFWGVHYNGVSVHSSVDFPTRQLPSRHLVVSVSESPAIKDALAPHVSMVTTSGGGYKLLCVIEGLVAGFVLSKGSCFKWDTCGPHAILLSLGGGVLDLKKALAVYRSDDCQSRDVLKERLRETCNLKYEKPDIDGLSAGETWSNTGGLVAYRDINVALDLLAVLEQTSLHC